MRRTSQARVRMAIAAGILLTLGKGAAAAVTCAPPTANLVNEVINGTRWELCWGNDAQKGLVLSQITLTPKPPAAPAQPYPSTLILESASLAQVYVAYDNSSGNQHFITDVGFPLTPLSATEDCPLGSLLQDGGGALVACRMIVPRGYSWRGTGQLQGKSLVLFGVSSAGGNTYIHQWVFQDDGTIHPMLGVSGQLDPTRDSTAATGWPISAPSRYATNRFHTAFWRLDFALGGQSNDLFQQLDYTPASGGYVHNQSFTDITSEGKFNINPDSKRFWLVKDNVISNSPNGQKIAFQIVPQHTSLHRGSNPLTNFDVYITQNKSCEKFASQNPTANGCGAGLNEFVNGEALSDPVAWVGTTYHQVPRAEDESDIQTHWQGYFLSPRDLTPTSPL